MPAKVITEILDKYATAPKSNMQALEDHELSIVFEHLTQNNQISNIAAIYADEPKKPEAPKVEAPKAEAPKAQPAAAQQTAKPAQQPQQRPAQQGQQKPAQAQPQQKPVQQVQRRVVEVVPLQPVPGIIRVCGGEELRSADGKPRQQHCEEFLRE